MNNKKRIVIIGATSAIAEHCARLWVQGEAVDLTLVGRDANRSGRVAADLGVRSPQSHIRVVQAEFLDPIAIETTVSDIVAKGSLDLVLIAHGYLPEQADCQDDLRVCREALEVNGVSPVLYAEAFARHMERANRGTIALIGSVAGDRGRRSNYAYGSAKGLVACYAQGLQHRFAGTRVKVVLIKPGPTATPMTRNYAGKGVGLAPVERVAEEIVHSVDQGVPVAYVPRKWRWVMLIIKHLPNFVFNKLNI